MPKNILVLGTLKKFYSLSQTFNNQFQENEQDVICLTRSILLYTVGENIIATIKMRNNFCYHLKIFFSPILR